MLATTATSHFGRTACSGCSQDLRGTILVMLNGKNTYQWFSQRYGFRNLYGIMLEQVLFRFLKRGLGKGLEHHDYIFVVEVVASSYIKEI